MSFEMNRPIESRRLPALTLVSLSLCGLVACVAQKPIDNQLCPCAPGWSCDPTINVCKRGGGAGGSVGIGGSGGFADESIGGAGGGLGGYGGSHSESIGGAGGGLGGCGGSNPEGVGGAGGRNPDGGINNSVLNGIWSGSVTLSAPGFFGPPLDTMRIVVGADGRPSYFDFTKFIRSQQFGPTAAEFPLDGTRDTDGPSGGCPSASCTFHVIVQEATFGATGFILSYRAIGSGLLPTTDFVETIDAALVGDHLQVKYTMQGTWGAAPADVVAMGLLARE
jgi:hypothetical protein